VIRILADENVPAASIARLRSEGLDVASAAESGPGADDATVLDQARAEKRILLTFDRDFGELIYRQGHPPPPALVYFRFSPATAEEPAVVFQGIVARREIVLEGRLTVVTREQIRQRPLPGTR
jgi:predicted nuclease of predicted toxin-antitoxin system